MHMVDMIMAVTEWEVTWKTVQEIGERRLDMMRAFNAREKISQKVDSFPEKFFNRSLKDDSIYGLKIDRAAFEGILTEYNTQCNWDKKSQKPDHGIAWRV